MTAGPRDTLDSLLPLLCTRATAAELADALGGQAAPSPRSPDYVRVAPTRYAALTGIDLLPWTDDESGVAVCALSTRSDWSRADVEDAVGPLAATPRIAGDDPTLQVAWERPGWAARAVVYVGFGSDPAAEDARVTTLEIRIESLTGLH